jgi:hypothetical protein
MERIGDMPVLLLFVFRFVRLLLSGHQAVAIEERQPACGKAPETQHSARSMSYSRHRYRLLDSSIQRLELRKGERRPRTHAAAAHYIEPPRRANAAPQRRYGLRKAGPPRSAGGYVYPERVLASDKKPIRVFLCDGRNDIGASVPMAFTTRSGIGFSRTSV